MTQTKVKVKLVGRSQRVRHSRPKGPRYAQGGAWRNRRVTVSGAELREVRAANSCAERFLHGHYRLGRPLAAS